MDSGYSYSTYMNWDIWVPVVVSFLTIILTIVVVKTSIIWFKCCSRGRHFIDFAYHFAKLVLRDSLQKETSPTSRMLLYDREVSPLSVVLLFTLAPAIFVPAFISFWGTFLVEESFACDSGLDCFLRDPTSFSISDQQPLKNCTDHENDTVVCFQFVFDYTGGFAAMGGFLAVAVTCLKVYGIVLIWLFELLPSVGSRQRRCHRCRMLCAVLSVFTFFLIPIILAAVILLLVLLVPLFSDIILQSNASILKFAAYWSSLLYVGPMAGGCMLAAVIGSNLSRTNFFIGERDLQDGGSTLEAGFSDSYNMSDQPPPREPSSVAASNLTSVNNTVKSKPKPVKGQWEEPDFKTPLVGSVVSSYKDVTTVPTRHSESSLLLGAAKTSDYQTT